MANEIKPKSGRGRWIALTVLLLIWIAGGIAQAVLWRHFDDDRTMQVMSVYFILPTAVFCTLVWWTFFSGFRWGTKLAGWGLLLVAVAAFFGTFRFEGFDGDFVPRFSYRWEPTAEELFLAARRAEAEYEGETAIKNDPDQPLTVKPGDWPQFRGPNRDGIVAEAPLRRDWNEERPNQLWRKRVGEGYSSFTVVEGLVFTQMQIGEDESVVCYDLETGQELWAHKDEAVRLDTFEGGVGPLATPTFYEGRLYTLGGTGILNCLNPQTGGVFWSTNVLKDAECKNLKWGMAASPLAYDGKIVVNPGSDDKQETAVAAYEATTGKKLWSAGTHQAGYCAPRLATIDGQRQLLIFDGEGLTGHSDEDGTQLWHVPWTNNFKINVAQPILRQDEAIFISNGYGVGSALVRAAKGSAGSWNAQTTDWETNAKFKLKFGDAVLKDGLIYGLSESILSCLNLSNGNIEWQQRGNFGFGQLILVEDVLIILTDKGEVVLLEITNAKPQELLRFQAIEGKTWNQPAFVNGRLLVRNAEEMACYDLRPKLEVAKGERGASAPR